MTITTAIQIKTPLLPNPGNNHAQSRIEPETDWGIETRELEAEWETLQSEASVNIMVYYKLFEKIRDRIAKTYTAYSESTATEVVSRLETIKHEISPHILKSS